MPDDPSSMSSQSPAAQVANVAGLVDYQAGGIISRQIVKKSTGNVTIFA